MKSAIHIAAEMYQENGLRLSSDLEYYLKYGYVFCTPERLLLAREINREDEGKSYVLPGLGDTWYVHFAVGKDCIPWFIAQAPSPRQWVGWARQFRNNNNPIHFYDFEKLKNRLLTPILTS